MSSSLRQRQRREIAENEARENTSKKRIATVQMGASNVMGTLYAVVLVSLLLLLVGVISKVRPNLLPWNRPPLPKQIIALLYPNNIAPLRDLVPVVSNYAICTPDNLLARNAVRYVIQQRQALKSRSLRVVLYPRESEQVASFARTTLCGVDFQEKYMTSPDFVRNDMYLWCLLQASRVQGIMEYGLVFHRTLNVYENMAAQYVSKNHRILSSLIISTSDSSVPSKVLNWTLSNNVNEWQEESDYRERMEKHLFQLIQDDTEKWTLLDAVCGEDNLEVYSSRIKLATICRTGEECCDIYEQLPRVKQRVQPQVDPLLLRH